LLQIYANIFVITFYNLQAVFERPKTYLLTANDCSSTLFGIRAM